MYILIKTYMYIWEPIFNPLYFRSVAYASGVQNKIEPLYYFWYETDI